MVLSCTGIFLLISSTFSNLALEMNFQFKNKNFQFRISFMKQGLVGKESVALAQTCVSPKLLLKMYQDRLHYFSQN